MKPIIFALAVTLIALGLAFCEPPPRVIDGNTLEWRGQRVRFPGCDAPELKQTCERYGVTWPCGEEAREALAEWVGSREIKCSGDERDKYGRLLAHCSVDGQDIGEWMVSHGLAIAYYQYSDDYQ